MSPPPPTGRKRHRTSGAGRSRWALLPGDLARLVASRLLAVDLLEYLRFRAVCAGWRSATLSPRGGRSIVHRRFHPWRWMMFPEGHGLYPGHPDLRGYIRFLNLDTGALVRVRLPLLVYPWLAAIDSIDGLLLLVRDQDSAILLLHPFTGDIAEFPPLVTLLPDPEVATILLDCPAPYRVRKLTRIVSASASYDADGGTITIMLALSSAKQGSIRELPGRAMDSVKLEIPIRKLTNVIPRQAVVRDADLRNSQWRKRNRSDLPD